MRKWLLFLVVCFIVLCFCPVTALAKKDVKLKVRTDFKYKHVIWYNEYNLNMGKLNIRGNELVGGIEAHLNGQSIFDEAINIEHPFFGGIVGDAVKGFGYDGFYWSDSGSLYLGFALICEPGDIQVKKDGRWPPPPEIPEYPENMPEDPWLESLGGSFWLVAMQGNMDVNDYEFDMGPYLNLTFAFNFPEYFFPDSEVAKKFEINLGGGFHEESVEVTVSTNVGSLAGGADIEFSGWEVGNSWHYHECPKKRTWYNCWCMRSEYDWFAELGGGLYKVSGKYKQKTTDIYAIFGLQFNQPLFDLRGESDRVWFTKLSFSSEINYLLTYREKKTTWSGMKFKEPVSGNVVKISEAFSETEKTIANQIDLSADIDLTVWENPKPDLMFDSVGFQAGLFGLFWETPDEEQRGGVYGGISVLFITK